jgi:hypothetical protein
MVGLYTLYTLPHTDDFDPHLHTVRYAKFDSLQNSDCFGYAHTNGNADSYVNTTPHANTNSYSFRNSDPNSDEGPHIGSRYHGRISTE